MGMTTTPAPSCTCSTSEASSPPLDPRGWLTPDEVVELLRGAVSLGTLRNYRSARIGPAYVRVARSVFYPRAEVDAWLAEQVRKSEDRWNDRY